MRSDKDDKFQIKTVPLLRTGIFFKVQEASRFSRDLARYTLEKITYLL